jgi:hypothetical protein
MAQTTDLQIAVNNLSAKRPRYDKLWRYYDGEAPLVYTSERLREVFSGLDARFTENWCAVVVDSVLDRMELRTPHISDDETMSAFLAELWEMTGLIEDEYTIHEDVAVTGESFVIAWPDDDGIAQAYHNDARLCHAEYDSDNPRRLRFAAKWWSTDAGLVRLTLYYPDRLEYYVSKREYKVGEEPSAKAFEPLGDEPVAVNPYGQIPVFHFRSNRRKVKSQLANVWSVQDMVNKTLADMMVAAEFGAFPQRYVISMAGVKGLKAAPNSIWDLVAGEDGAQPTTAGQFSAMPLSNYLEAINKLTADIGIITRTPRHYFFVQGGDPSGEALIAMEAPLTKKVDRLEATLIPTWRDLAAFLLALEGSAARPQDIVAEYLPGETVQPRTQAEIRKINVEAGLPLDNVLRDEGWTEGDLTQLNDDREAERLRERSYADAVLSAAQRDFDRGEAV